MSGKSVVGSIIASVVIMSAITFLALPFIFPAISEKNILLQSKYQEWNENTPATIYDYKTTYIMMNNTEMNITIKENSQLAITFSSMGRLWLSYWFDYGAEYSISLVVNGIGNRTFLIYHYDTFSDPGWPRYITYNLYINYVTDPLPAGTYNIAMYWKSEFDTSEITYLSVAYTGYKNTRSLWVQELATL